MSIAAIITHLQATLPTLSIAEPSVVDLPARKQQDTQAFYNLLKPLFTPAGSDTATLYPLTAKQSDGVRPTPDGIYGVVKSEQRTFQGKAVATLIGFSLEIRATSYQALVGQEDAVRAALAATTGVETVNALDDYDDDAALYVSALDVELSAPIADVLVMEGAVKTVGKQVCPDVFPVAEQDYALLFVASGLDVLQTRRDAARTALTGWCESSHTGLMLFIEGQPLPIDCGLYAWLDTYRHTQYRR
jgi:hypothetical protein